ncbi:hypothetical protein HWV62_11674 [Athelia sp. TMB]|nr:hypothetical protein HWV62_11674 [Athelia sp. TMB]
MHRQATVYDQTSLALHPTGARAQKKHTNVVLDARGNLIARDAGGWSRVPKRGRADITEEEKGKSKQGEATEYLRMEEEEEEDDGLKDYRARKRRKAIHDHDFLGSPPPDASLPSSDLLKQIHSFAANWYTEHEMLHDGTREYRRDKKAKKDAKLAVAAASISAEPDTEIDDDDGDASEPESDGDSTKGRGKMHSKVKRQRKGKKQVTARRDMYKVFDGSALLVIGMLLQHRTANLLRPTLADPNNWEAEMIIEQEEGGLGVGVRKGKWRKPVALIAKDEEAEASITDAQ